MGNCLDLTLAYFAWGVKTVSQIILYTERKGEHERLRCVCERLIAAVRYCSGRFRDASKIMLERSISFPNYFCYINIQYGKQDTAMLLLFKLS